MPIVAPAAMVDAERHALVAQSAARERVWHTRCNRIGDRAAVRKSAGKWIQTSTVSVLASSRFRPHWHRVGPARPI
ncbi:MAG: hypothetical protein JWR80_4832 [Bradyrhizobium sp.]|nr:hypothetical protein [Bradyrhizobium sp.]